MKLPRDVPILVVLVVAAAGVSCADIATPSRNEAYEWRRILPTGPTSADTMSFHWPRSHLPVRIWAEDSLNLVNQVQEGVELWKAAFLYGEFDAVLVSDSAAADVVVRVASAVKGGFTIIRLESALAPECQGGTDFELPPGSRQLQLPIRVFVNPRFDPTAPGVDDCMALTTTHELGHALGIFAHSPNETDIMFGDPTVSTLSTRDRAAAELAYHIEPTLTVPPR